MRHATWVLLGLLATGTAGAAAPTDQGIARFLPEGMQLQARLDADLTGDGRDDLALLAGNDDARALVVLARLAAPGGDEEFEPIDQLTLEVTPLGPGHLSMRKGVLILEDLVGGTTATAATYRYRFDPDEDRMRLIGLDAERYSRTNSHGGTRLSWNLLNGAQVLQQSQPVEGGADDDGAYRYSQPQRTVQKVVKVFMDQTPNPDDLIDNELAAQLEE